MQRRRVESRSIHSIGYDDKSKSLEVEFLSNGAVYRYLAVDEDVYHGMVAAESVGRYFHERIRNQYIYDIVREITAE